MAAGAERADLGHFRRTEAAREGELALVGHLLAAEHQHRMLLERGARRRIGGIVTGDIGKRDAAQFGGKTRTQRDDVHGAFSRFYLFSQVFRKCGVLARKSRHRAAPAIHCKTLKSGEEPAPAGLWGKR